MSLLLFLAAAACAPSPYARIAEILYDAAGDDTGREFVEFFNPHAGPLSLAGARLEAGDGSAPGRWSLRWTGSPRDSIAAGGRFVIGGTLMDPPPDAVATLDLQNGPDAVRLTWPDGATEVVGYGVQEFAEYACGTSAPDVPSGQSLARIPDASDLGSNALDFRPATPSPGRANQPRRDVALVPGSLALDPERPDVGQPARLRGALLDRGSDALTASEVTLRGSIAAGADLFAIPIDRALAPSDTAGFEVSLTGLAAGRQVLRVVASLPGDEENANDVDSLAVRVGDGPLGLTEIQFHPKAGEGEWVEVRNQLGQALAPAGFTLADRRGTRGLARGAGSLAADSLGLLVQDRAAFLKDYRDVDSLRVWQVSPWPSLNNADGADGIADAVLVREPDGTLADRVDYSAHGVPAGTSLERVAGSWVASLEPGGTPLRPPRAPLAVERFDVSPRRLALGQARARIAWSLPWARARVSVEAFDLAGRRAAEVVAETSVAGRGEVVWPVSALPAGLYVLVLKARAESGSESIAASRPVRVVGGVP